MQLARRGFSSLPHPIDCKFTGESQRETVTGPDLDVPTFTNVKVGQPPKAGHPQWDAMAWSIFAQ
jgi:hypothetical protein